MDSSPYNPTPNGQTSAPAKMEELYISPQSPPKPTEKFSKMPTNPTKRIRRKNAQKHKEHREKLVGDYNECFWCGKVLIPPTATLDHIIPISAIGTKAETPENWVLACNLCQSRRKNYTDQGRPYFHNLKDLFRMTQALRSRKREETLENYLKLLPEWKKEKIGKGAIQLFLSEKRNEDAPEKIWTLSLTEDIQTTALKNKNNPILYPPWPNISGPITIQEVQKAELLEEPSENSREFYLWKIAHAPKENNSFISATLNDGQFTYTEGAHRLISKILRRHKMISIHITGNRQGIENFRPKPRNTSPFQND